MLRNLDFISFLLPSKSLIFEQTWIYALAWFLQHKTTKVAAWLSRIGFLWVFLFFFLNLHPSCDFIIGPCVAVSTNLNQFHMLAQFYRKYKILVGFKMSLMVSVVYTVPFMKCVRNCHVWSYQTKSVGICFEDSR